MADHHSSGKHGGSDQQKHAYRRGGNDAANPDVSNRAVSKEGGVGGISGTGQALPHHGFDESAGESVGQEASFPAPDAGSTYQTGGSHLNRDRQEAVRKERLSGSTVAGQGRAGPDTAPGAPTRRE